LINIKIIYFIKNVIIHEKIKNLHKQFN